MDQIYIMFLPAVSISLKDPACINKGQGNCNHQHTLCSLALLTHVGPKKLVQNYDRNSESTGVFSQYLLLLNIHLSIIIFLIKIL